MRRFFPALLAVLLLPGRGLADDPARWWPAATEAALPAAGPQRAELTRALTEVPAAQRASLQFLLENMPPVDRAALTAAFLLKHVALAHLALAKAPWGEALPTEIFLNDVLPYASLNERRDDAARATLRELAAPLVQDCQTPGAAARVLNEKLFGVVKVHYSTTRKKPDQSALESMASGVATCSGLSILLVEACRSVGVPARVVGTPLWTNLRGNHTWVEIWDGDWHFVGAAEPDRQGLDHGWFAGEAAKADDTQPQHRIYASSFKKTGVAFPLVWDESIGWVPAVNVTARYTAAAKSGEGTVRLLVRVLDRAGGQRRAAQVTVTDAADPAKVLFGTSRDERADLNNILPFQIAPKHRYKVAATLDGRAVSADLTTTDAREQITTLTLGD